MQSSQHEYFTVAQDEKSAQAEIVSELHQNLRTLQAELAAVTVRAEVSSAREIEMQVLDSKCKPCSV